MMIGANRELIKGYLELVGSLQTGQINMTAAKHEVWGTIGYIEGLSVADRKNEPHSCTLYSVIITSCALEIKIDIEPLVKAEVVQAIAGTMPCNVARKIRGSMFVADEI